MKRRPPRPTLFPYTTLSRSDSAAARRREPVRAPTTSGTSTHGARAMGHISIEAAPMPVTIRGESAYASPATSCVRSEEHTSELQSRQYLVCRLLLEKKKTME